ncbi:hypothetical protein ATCC90586_009514 [Pythium insidiosum]|nr:hypothetical protein ATCC90586_009514 [Pythium insidiosum]
MGLKSSQAVEQAVRATPLETPPSPLLVTGAAHCSDHPRTLLIKHTATATAAASGDGGSAITASEFVDGKIGELVFRVSHSDHQFTCADAAGDAVCVLSLYPTGAPASTGNVIFFTAMLPPSDKHEDGHLGTLWHKMKTNEAVTIGQLRDRVSGEQYFLGYTGIWKQKHTAVIWLANMKAEDTRLPIARVVPASLADEPSSYCLEVARGIDASALMMAITVLDCGAWFTD